MLLINFLELGVVAARVISWQVANMPSTCHHPAMALRGHLQKGTLVTWQGNGMACVNQTRPHYVNQMGKTQSNDLAERHGMCESAFTEPEVLFPCSLNPATCTYPEPDQSSSLHSVLYSSAAQVVPKRSEACLTLRYVFTL
jgi:hypothetical protein